MTITFWCKRNGNWFNLKRVTKVEKRKSLNNGHYTNFWFVYFGDGKSSAYKCVDYDIIDIELRN